MKRIIIMVLFTIAYVISNGQSFTTLGVGVTQPVGTLHVHSATSIVPPVNPGTNEDGGNRDLFPFNYSTIFHVTNNNTGTLETDGFSITQDNYDITIRQFEEGGVNLLGYNGQGITLTPTGLFGVGTTVPTYRLHVVGDGYMNGDMAVTGSGWVGLGYQKLSIGAANGANLSYGTAYVGFNARRTSSGWNRLGDGNHNGGAVLWATVNGDILFANIPSDGGGVATVMSDQELKAKVNLKLCADGLLMAKEVKVTLTEWPDYVFGVDYHLMPLDETESYIKENGHLPGVPTAAVVEEEGLSLGEINKVLLQKVEELTMHVIELQKQIIELKKGVCDE